MPILRGRILAVLLFGGYVFGGYLSPWLRIACALLIALLAPWMVVRGLRFRARYAAWRGLHFRFVGSYGEAYAYYLLIYLLVPLTLGIIYPFVKFQQKRFVVESHRFGGSKFQLRANAGDFYGPYVLAFFVLIAWWLVATMGAQKILVAVMVTPHSMAPPPVWLLYVLVGVFYAGALAVVTFLNVALTNVVFNGAELAGHRLRSSLLAVRMIGLYVSNTIAILFSLGMLIPWAMVRVARYRASCLTLLANGDLDRFVAEAGQEEGAAGAEMDSLFDIDIGF